MSKHSESIRNWSEDDRPREKFIFKGRKSLSDAELIAILLGSGSARESAVALAQRILAGSGNNLNELGKIELSQLKNFKGIGDAKAVTLLAALELGRRRASTLPVEKPQITGSADGFKLLQPYLSDLPHEEFYMLILNRANRLLEIHHLSKGGTAGTVVDIKLLLKKVLEVPTCAGFIIAHNHPSGQLKPSEADKALTAKIKMAAHSLDLALLDHLIIGDKSYLSFADEGIL